MRDAAEQRQIPIVSPPDANAVDAREQLAALKPDLLVVCDYGQILSSEALSVASLGGINLHGSLLPKYRGAAPVAWAVLNGESETGVTVIHMTPRLDAGPCLTQSTTPIDPEETAAELETRLAEMGVAAVHKALAMLATWDGAAPLGQIQNPAAVSRAPRLRKADGRVCWSRTAQQIKNQVRGLKPWPGTYTFWRRPQGDPVRLILDRVSMTQTDPQGATPGAVKRSDRNHLEVATGDGCLSLDQVQPAGKRVMEIAEFLRGHRVQAGEMMGEGGEEGVEDSKSLMSRRGRK